MLQWRGDLVSATHQGVPYRLWFEDTLRYALADAFVMSHMRDLEARLRASNDSSDDVEQEIPFWSFSLISSLTGAKSSLN